MNKPQQWATGTGQWCRWTTLVLASPDVRRSHEDHQAAGEVLVWTPLDLIRILDREGEAISTVILAGRYATDRELVGFLRETYPRIDVVSDCADEAPVAHATRELATLHA